MDFSNRMDMATAACYLGRSTHWLSVNRVRLGIPAYRIGRRYFFLKEELDAWLQDQRVTDCPTTALGKSKYLTPIAL